MVGTGRVINLVVESKNDNGTLNIAYWEPINADNIPEGSGQG